MFQAAAHESATQALARWERERPGEVLVVTQNVDDLHERAGTQNLIHMHGKLLKMRCKMSEEVFPIARDLGKETLCVCCGEKGRLRPHIVWFGEMPLEMDVLHAVLSNCALFVSIGTSGVVYPAAGFARVARAHGARTVELNLERSAVNADFDRSIHGPASEVVPAFVAEMLGG